MKKNFSELQKYSNLIKISFLFFLFSSYLLVLLTSINLKILKKLSFIAIFVFLVVLIFLNTLFLKKINIFFLNSIIEIKKVSLPKHNETFLTTIIIFGSLILISLFFLLTDKFLELFIYNIFLF